MRKQRITTLKEIAKQLELSVSTISRALNDHPDISESTKKKVVMTAKSLNYVPNLFARGFRKHKTNIVGVIVPSITHYFTSTVLKGIIDEANTNGYRVITSESNNDIKKQTEMLHTMIKFGVDGILLSLSKMSKDIDSVLDILEKRPLILFDKVSPKVPCTQIVVDEEEAAYKAVEHLINLGKKRIAILKESETSYSSEKRFKGYLKALKDHNIVINGKFILSTNDISLTQGQRMASILLSLKTVPDAIFAITDDAAVGAIKTLKKHKVNIPRQIAVVGFSNSPDSEIIEPNLTTIDQPGSLIGSTAMKYLIEEIEKDSEPTINKTIEIKTNLIIRESSFKA
jgi:LacI family transcriptional regulator